MRYYLTMCLGHYQLWTLKTLSYVDHKLLIIKKKVVDKCRYVLYYIQALIESEREV